MGPLGAEWGPGRTPWGRNLAREGPLGPHWGGFWPGKGPLGPFGVDSGPGRAPWAPWAPDNRFCGELRFKKVIFRRIPARKRDFPENSGSNLMFFCARKLALSWAAPPAVFPDQILTCSRYVAHKLVKKKLSYDPRDLSGCIRAGMTSFLAVSKSRDLLWRPIW